MTEYGKLDCRHEATTPIIDLGLNRCDECGEVMRPRPKLTRYEWLRRLSVEEVAKKLFALKLLCLDCKKDRCPGPMQCYKAWLMEEVEV